MRISAAAAADLPDVERITEAAFAPYVPRLGMRPAPMDADYAARIEDGAVWVARRDGPVVGFCVLLARPDHLLLDVVATDRPGLGIGGRLIAFAEQQAVERGLGEIRLYTHQLMSENISLYGHRGYRVVDGPGRADPPRALRQARAVIRVGRRRLGGAP